MPRRPSTTITGTHFTATINPAPNAAGWNNTDVTITYSCAAGANGGASLSPNGCPAPVTVSTEGLNQSITGTVTDTAGISASATVVLNIDKTPPTLSVTSITSITEGQVFTSSSQTFPATASDTLSGLASATCNGTVAPVTSGSFSCNISLTPGVNLIVVQVADTAGNVGGLPLHVILNAALPAPTSLTITPTGTTLLIGAIQQFTAIDQNGKQRNDAVWSVDNSSLASITTDSSPILTALSSGQVTLTASVGSVSVQDTLTILSSTSMPVGTIRWSAPAVPGFTTQQIVQAVPTSNNTPDLYAIDTNSNLDVLIRAFTGDGQQMWRSTYTYNQLGFITQMMGDSLGGLALVSTTGITDIDGQTGAMLWQNPNIIPNNVAIGQDGSLFSNDANASFVKLDPLSGNSKTVVPPTQNQSTIENGTCVFGQAFFQGSSSGSSPSASQIAFIDDVGNQFVYFPPSTSTVQSFVCTDSGSPDAGDPQGTFTSSTIPGHLAKLDPSGAILATWPDGGAFLAPDGHGGALISYNNNGNHTIFNTTTGVSYADPLGGLTGVVIGENGNPVGTNGQSIAAFDISSGQIQWSYSPTREIVSMIATVGGGIVAKGIDNSLIPIDMNGVVGDLANDIPSRIPWSLGAWPAINAGILNNIQGPVIRIATTAWAVMFGGNSEQSNKSQSPVVSQIVPVTESEIGATKQATVEALTVNGKVPTVFFQPDSTYLTFAKELAKPLDAFGFIGHSIDYPSSTTLEVQSIGLLFYPRTAWAYTIDPINPNLTYQFDPQIYPTVIPAQDTKIQTQVRVVFIGSCFIGSTFKALWNINDTTSGQVMIVPENPASPVYLGHSLVAWKRILQDMVIQKMNVWDAVQETNGYLPTQKDNDGHVITEKWTVIGDHNVKF